MLARMKHSLASEQAVTTERRAVAVIVVLEREQVDGHLLSAALHLQRVDLNAREVRGLAMSTMAASTATLRRSSRARACVVGQRAQPAADGLRREGLRDVAHTAVCAATRPFLRRPIQGDSIASAEEPAKA